MFAQPGSLARMFWLLSKWYLLVFLGALAMAGASVALIFAIAKAVDNINKKLKR